MKQVNISMAACLIALLSAPAPAAAASDNLTLADLSRGDRVRLRLAEGGKKVQGTVESAGEQEVLIRPKDSRQPLLTLSPQQFQRLEVTRGRRSRWGRGALIGFVPGAVFMTALAFGLDECYRDCDRTSDVLIGLAGGAATATAGALIGLAVKTDAWVPVSTGRPRVALDLAPARGGFRANVTLRF